MLLYIILNFLYLICSNFRILLSDIHNKSQPLDELMEELNYTPIPDTEALWEVPQPLIQSISAKTQRMHTYFIDIKFTHSEIFRVSE